MHDVFISYSNKDKAMADAACAVLEQNKIKCWYAPRDVVPGEEWASSIVDAIDNCKVFVLIFSEFSNASPQVIRELERAVNAGVPIIPFKITNAIPTGSMAYYLSTIHWLDAMTTSVEECLAQLTVKVAALLDVSVNESTTAAAAKAQNANYIKSKQNRRPLGFRTGKIYGIVLTSIYFLFVAFLIFAFFFSEPIGLADTLWYAIIIAMLVVPYLVLSDFFGGIRKMPILKKTPLLKSIIIILIIEALLIVGIVLVDYHYYEIDNFNVSMASEDVFADTDANDIKTYGATNSNIMNGGTAVEKDGWLYYVSDVDFMLHKIELSKVTDKIDDRDSIRILDEYADYLNIVDDWLYFRDYGNLSICKIRLDGSERKTLNSAECFSLSVVDDWIFYIDGATNNVCRMKTDGSSQEVIAGTTSAYMQIYDGWIYVIEDDYLGRYRSDASRAEYVAPCNSSLFAIEDDWVYYVNLADGRTMYRMRLDGSENTKLCDDKVDGFNVYEDRIYFSNGSDLSTLHVIDVTGGISERINDYPIIYICIAGDWIFCSDTADPAHYYQYKTS